MLSHTHTHIIKKQLSETNKYAARTHSDSVTESLRLSINPGISYWCARVMENGRINGKKSGGEQIGKGEGGEGRRRARRSDTWREVERADV